MFSALLSCIFLSFVCSINAEETENLEAENMRREPTVMVTILVRNKAHVLPYFFHYLEKQDYPKDRMSIW